VIGMLGMGMTTDPWQMLQYIKKPVGPIIGLICQFLIMPCITMIAIKVVNFASYETLAVMLYGCAPGGGISNIIIYWMDGDLDLSITMTMVSCVMALGFSPLWLLAVPKLLDDGQKIDIPFAEISINIATVVLPALLGTFLFWLFKEKLKRPRIIEIASKIITTVVTLLLLVVVILGSYKYQLTAIITVAQVVYAFLLPFIGYTIAHLLSWAVGATIAKRFNLGQKQYVTIGVETGVQNGRMVNAITQIIYATNPYAMAQTFFFPFLAFAAQVAYGVIAALSFRLYKRFRPEDPALGDDTATSKGVKNPAYDDTAYEVTS